MRHLAGDLDYFSVLQHDRRRRLLIARGGQVDPSPYRNRRATTTVDTLAIGLSDFHQDFAFALLAACRRPLDEEVYSPGSWQTTSMMRLSGPILHRAFTAESRP
jgi:hypothetical protein